MYRLIVSQTMAVMKAYQREYINKLVTPNRKEFALTLKNIGTIDQETILEEAADHSRLDVDTLRHALNALTNTAVLYLKVGHGVQFGNFGSLQPSINVKAVTKKEDCNVKTMIGGVKINMQPTGTFAKAIADMKVQLVSATTADKSEGDGDNSNVAPADGDDDNPPSGGGNSNNSGGTGSGNQGGQQQGGSGNQQQTVEDVTYTFKYHDNTEDTRTGQPGEAVNAPAADSGYHWPSDQPTVFGNVNRTFTEIEDSAQLSASEGVTVKWTWHADNKVNGSALAKEMIVPVGSTIDESEWPEAHAGYHWNSTPEDLNLNVPYKRAGEWYYIREQIDE